MTYGFSDEARFTAVDVMVEEKFTRFTVLKDGESYNSVVTPLYGKHNISNLLSVIAMADFLGIPAKPFAEAAETFEGIKRRQEVIGQRQGIIILDDFAHHPTAVRETIDAVREKYKGRRLIAVFEPRSNSSRRNIFQEQYVSSFEAADLVMIPEAPMMEKIPPEERFSSKRLTEDLEKSGKPAFYFPDTDQLLEAMVNASQANDIFLIMSNGGFDNIHHRLLERL
jgi:UDP-N-acetylmuramate: L-alanyl-gamma-D-glutamyl-meso-diaminopimelate ligase